MQKYPSVVEKQMKRFFISLPEHESRRYAAVEALKLGHGGKKYICDLLGCHFLTLERGLAELESDEPLEIDRIRKSGAGRPPYEKKHSGIDDAFLNIIDHHTAGSPMDETIKWTNLSRQDLANALKEVGFDVSVTVVDQLLKKHDFRRRQAVKSVAGGRAENRDEQFQNIERLKGEYLANGNPVISMDTKKKK